MAVKSVGAQELYSDFVERVRNAIEDAVTNDGDSVASIANRLGASRSAINSLRNGSYESTITATLLIALDLEFDLGIFKK